MQKAMDEESIRATISHEGVRQLTAAAGLLPRTVAAPEWVQFGMASFFETPHRALWSGTGALSWLHLHKFKTLAKDKKTGRAEDVLLGVITDDYFRKAIAELGTVGRMATKALPLLVLVIIFAFFSTEMWQIADGLPRWRLWLVVAAFAVLAVLFMVVRLDEELRVMIDKVAAEKLGNIAGLLAGTPLASCASERTAGMRPRPRRRAARTRCRPSTTVPSGRTTMGLHCSGAAMSASMHS